MVSEFREDEKEINEEYVCVCCRKMMKHHVMMIMVMIKSIKKCVRECHDRIGIKRNKQDCLCFSFQRHLSRYSRDLKPNRMMNVLMFND